MRSLLANVRDRAVIVALCCLAALSAACIDVTMEEPPPPPPPPPSGCGDGVQSDGEACDLGTANSDERGGCTAGCEVARCGDALVRIEEECDLGDENSATGACTPDCTLPVCGDLFVHPPEEDCDLGSENGGPLCDGSCMVPAPVCGDGSVQVGEECDLGAENGGDRCGGDCRLPPCGNGRSDPGEECDEGAASSPRSASCTGTCELPRCGDGLRSPKEDCDGDAPGCTAACTAPTCGVAAVALGMHQTYARMRDGRLIGAGNDEGGQLGRDTSGSLGGVPVEIGGDRLWHITAGGGSGAGLTDDGRLFTWGANGSGQLGLGDFEPHAGRVEPMAERRFRDVSAHGDHLLAIDEEGNLWSWGADSFGEVGGGLGLDEPCGETGACVPTPFQPLPGEHWVGAFAAPRASYALRADGAVFGFGLQNSAQLGDATSLICSQGLSCVRRPVQLPGLPPIRAVGATDENAALLDLEGGLWLVGRGPAREGDDQNSIYTQPAPLEARNPDGTPARFVAVEGGEYHLLALDDRGQVWGAGSNNEGQLGRGDQSGSFLPLARVLPAGTGPAVAIQAAWRHSAVLLADGELLVTGWSNYGMLGWEENLGGTRVFTPFPACP